MFAQGIDVAEVADRLRVTMKSVRLWKHRWKADGVQGLASVGHPGQRCRLGAADIERLETALDAGPASWGYVEDRRWTLARIAALIKRLFGADYSLPGTYYLLHRLGWSAQVPVARSVKRDEDAIATWVKDTWPQVKAPRRPREPGSVSKTKQARD
jgi:transposase